MPNSVGVRMEVEGETEYKRSLSNIIAETKELDAELRATATNFDKHGRAQATNAQKVDILKKKIKLQNEALEQAKKNAAAAAEEHGEYSDQAIKARTTVATLTTQLNRMNNELKEAGGSSIGAKFKDMGEGLKGISEKGVKVGETLSTHVTAPILAIGAASYAAWSEVDDGLDTVVTMTGATGEALEGLQGSLQTVYSNSSIGMDTLAASLGEVNTRFGFTGEQLESATELFAEFAEINGDDVVGAVDSADKVMKQFSVSTDQMDGYLGLLTKTAQDTGMSTSDLQGSLEKNGATLRAMGLDVGESITLMGRMSKAGLDDETAMKAMTKAAQKYSKSGDDVAEGMETLIAGVQDGSISFEELADVVGSKNALAFEDMAKSGQLSLDDLGTSLDDYTDVVGATFDDTQDPIDEMTKVFHQLKVAGASLFNAIGRVAVPIIAKLSAGVQKLTGWWGKLNPKTQDMIVKIAGIAAVAGPVILIGSKIVGFISTLLTIIPAIGAVVTTVVGVIASPIGLIAAAVAGVVAVVMHLWKTNEGFRDAVVGIWNGIASKIKGIVSGLVGIVTGIWNTIKGVFSGDISIKEIATTAWDNAKAAAGAAWDAIVGFFTGAAPVVAEIATTAWDNAKTFASDTWDSICGFFTSAAPVVAEIATTAWDNAKTAASNVWDAITGFFTSEAPVVAEIATTAWENAKTFASDTWDAITGFFSGAAPTVAEIATTAWDNAKTAASDVWDAITGFFSGAAPTVAEIATTAWDNAKTAASDAWDAITGFFSGAAPTVAEIATTAWDNAKSAASDAWDNIKGAFEGAAPVVKSIAITAWTNAQSFAKTSWDAIKNAFSGAAPVVKEIATTAWENAQSFATSAWDTIKGAFEGAAPVVAEIATTAWDNAKTAASTVWDGIVAIFSGDFPFPDIGKLASDAFDAVKTAASSAWDWICGLFGGGGEDSKELKTGEVDISTVTGATQDMVDTVGNAKLVISAVNTDALVTANSKVATSVQNMENYFKNSKPKIPTVNSDTVRMVMTAVSTACKNMVKYFSAMKPKVPTVNTNTVRMAMTAVSTATKNMSTSFSNMKLKIPTVTTSALTTAYSTVRSQVNAIKSLMNFSWTLPKLKVPAMPHISPTFTARQSPDGKVTAYQLGYNTNWYDRGGVFYDPAVIGVAEKRPEFVGALSDLKEVVKAAMAEGGGRTFVQNNYSPKSLSRLEIYRQTKNFVTFAMG